MEALVLITILVAITFAVLIGSSGKRKGTTTPYDREIERAQNALNDVREKARKFARKEADNERKRRAEED